ncbi:N-acetylglucosamine kinase [Erwinia oleae]|uniref:N-acetylglucosamine kinase n=1 Tax=Erwinia oleae TaxID=796334 RepID=UPI0009078F3C|nr:BadF/BadG/BcrA/BcrD ATPase family protein [Erwinia oleae]
MTYPPLVIGVDVGGTKTRWMAQRGKDSVVDQTVPTSSWRRESYSASDCFRLKALIESSIGYLQPRHVVIGANGCNTDQRLLQCEETFGKTTGWDIRVLNDAELLPAAAGGDGGIAVISGTGSIVVARNTEGALLTVGGWGWLLGDEGGGAGLVRAAIRSCLAAAEAREHSDVLHEFLLKHLKITDLREANERLSIEPSAAMFASHTIALFDAIEQGSKLGVGVVRAQVADLRDKLASLLLQGARGPVYLGGGIFERLPYFYQAFIDAANELSSDLDIVLVATPPVVGALNIASVRLARGEGFERAESG